MSVCQLKSLCFVCRQAHSRDHPAARGALAAGLLCVCIHGCIRVDDPRSGNDAAAATTPVFRDVNLGILRRAPRREMVIRLANRTRRPVPCTELRTSCGCLSVVANKTSIDPSDDALAMVRLDLADRPGFVGNLAVEATAVDSDGAESFRFNVLAEVVPEDDLAFCAEATP